MTLSLDCFGDAYKLIVFIQRLRLLAHHHSYMALPTWWLPYLERWSLSKSRLLESVLGRLLGFVWRPMPGAAKGIPSNTCEMLSRCLPLLNLPLEAERKALAQLSPQCPLLDEDHNLARVVEDAAGRLPTKQILEELQKAGAAACQTHSCYCGSSSKGSSSQLRPKYWNIRKNEKNIKKYKNI